eukprot:COSAG02_NODE_1174_length_14082_cov_1929.950154_12_plen_332_part_00
MLPPDASFDEASGTWLSPAQLQTWVDDGMLLLEGMFSPQEVEAMRAEANYLLENSINSSLFHNRRSGRLDWRVRADGKQLVRKIQPINDMSLTFATFSADARLTGPLAELMGEEPVLFEEKLNYKQPLAHPVPGLEQLPMAYTNSLEGVRPDSDWGQHNDYAYYIAQDYPPESISTAVVLDDCTVENGALIMWPGSHKQHRIHDSNPELGGAQDVRRTGDLGIDPDTGWRTGPDPIVDPSVGKDMLLKAGSILHFSILTVHNSHPNFTDEPRRLMIYTHHPQSWEGAADIRNGSARLREAPWERAYLQACIEAKPGTHQYSLKLLPPLPKL